MLLYISSSFSVACAIIVSQEGKIKRYVNKQELHALVINELIGKAPPETLLVTREKLNIRSNVSRVQLPDPYRLCRDVNVRGIIEEEHASRIVYCLCRVHARRNARPSSLSKALHDGVVNLRRSNQCNSLDSECFLCPMSHIMYWQINMFDYGQNTNHKLTSILTDRFSPLSTGTTLP
jgi:hypothetical protein